MTYSLNCANGHEPETMNVEADSDEEAMGKMMETSKAHNAEKHPDMSMGDEEMKAFISSNWTKA